MEKAKQTKKIIALFLIFLILFSVSATPISLAVEMLNSTYYKIDNSKNMISRVEPETKVEEFKTKMNADESDLKLYQDKTCLQEVTTGFVGTGMALKYDGKVYEISVVGDFDKDGKATQVELTNIIRHIVGFTSAELTGIYYESADLTGDGAVDQRDITKYIRYIVYGELDLGKVDTTPPILTLKTEDVQASSATVVAQALDKETGMGDNPTFTFYLKKANEPDTSYVEKQKGTNNEFNITGLISNTEYEVKAVTHDKAGNKAEETIKLTTKSIEGTIKFSKETWNAGQASIDITSTTSYTIEYQINSNTGSWITGTSGKVTVNNLNHNDIVYARLTDDSTRTQEQTKQIKDEIAPTITLNIEKGISNLNVTATAQDNETGIALTEQYTIYIKEDGQTTYTYVGVATLGDPLAINNLLANTDYTVKVEIQDKAGNIGTKEQTISTGSLPDVTQSGALTFGAVTWNGGKAQTTISTNTTFTIEYQVNGTEDGAWQTITNGGDVTNLNDNDVVYAHLTEGANASNTTSITIKDSINPNVTLNLSSTTSTITVVVTAQDNETGIDALEEYVFYLNGVEKQRNTLGTYTFTGLTADANYTVKVEIADKAGNVGSKEQGTSTQNVPSASQPGNIMFNAATWVSGKAEVTITTNTSYCIEYQINSTTGTWTAGNIGIQTLTVQSLNHNDVIYARLTDGTNAGSYISQTIVDAISPNVTLNLVPGTQEITATAQATDDESGIVANVTYKFSIKETGADDSTYVETQNTISNICTFTGLVDGKDYTIKVEVQDKAGNTGIKEESAVIPDNIAPEVTLNVTNVTSNTILVEATATDTVAMPETPIYVFYIKKTGETDSSYTKIQETSSNTCTFTNLETNIDYTIKVEVDDEAGNTGMKETSSRTVKIPDGTDAGAITFSNITWSMGKAQVTILTNTTYTIEYQVNGTSGNWVAGTTVSNLNHGDVVYARLTDGVNSTSPATLNVVDEIKPTVTLSLEEGLLPSEITATAQAKDMETGLANDVKYKFSIKEQTQSDTQYIVKQETSSAASSITGLKADTTYMVKVEVEDIAGNKQIVVQSIKTKSMPNPEQTGALVFSTVVWSGGKASTTMSTNTSFDIEYQVNSVAGAWTKGTSVGNLNHGDVVYARLTDGISSTKSVSLNIADTIKPEEFTISVTDITSEGFKIKGSTIDNESGIKDYTYVVEKRDGGTVVNVSSTKAGESYNINSLNNNSYSNSNISIGSNVINVSEITGIFNKAKEAKETYNLAQAREQLQLEIADIQLEVLGSENREATLNDMYTMLNPNKWSSELFYDPIADALGIVTKPTFAKVNKINTPYIFTVDDKLIIRDVEIGEAKVKLIEFSEATWNSGKAEVTLSTEAIGTIEYKVGESGTYREGTKVENLLNGDTIFARINKDGQYSEEERYTVSDKVKPEEFTITTSNITETGVSITGNTVDNQSGLANYTYVALNSDLTPVVNYTSTQTSYDVTGLEMGTEYIVYMLATDNAGNVRKSNEENITTNIDEDSLYDNIIIKLSTEEWTKNDISVEIDFGIEDSSSVTKEISLDGGTTYKKYTGKETISTNTKVKAKLTIKGKEIVKDKVVNYIDRLEPNTFNVSVTDNISSSILRINASTTDKEATDDYAISGIKGYKYYIYQEDTLVDSSELTGSSYEVSDLVAGQTYKIYAIAYDNAENSVKSEELEYQKKYVWEVYSTEKVLIDYEITLTPWVKNIYSDGEMQGYSLSGANNNEDSIIRVAKNNLELAISGKYFNLKGSSWKAEWYRHCDAEYIYGRMKNKIIANSTSAMFSSNGTKETTNVVAYYINDYSEYSLKGYELKPNAIYEYSKGQDFIWTLSSENAEEYPDNGEQGDYWYIKI